MPLLFLLPFFIFAAVCGHVQSKTKSASEETPACVGADEGNRTLYIQLGKLTFYR